MNGQTSSPAARRLAVVAACVLAPMVASAQGQPVERSFEEFLAAQGTFCLPDGIGGCLLLNPPLPNTLAWQDTSSNYLAFVDYAGIASKYLAEQSGGSISLGTAIKGRVSEITNGDGTAEFTVTLSADNSLMWIVEGGDFATSPVVFGANVDQVLQGARPTLGSVMLRARVLMGGPGQPLPDLFQVLAYPAWPQSLLEITFSAHSNSDSGGHANILHKSVWEHQGASYLGPMRAEIVTVR